MKRIADKIGNLMLWVAATGCEFTILAGFFTYYFFRWLREKVSRV